MHKKNLEIKIVGGAHFLPCRKVHTKRGHMSSSPTVVRYREMRDPPPRVVSPPRLVRRGDQGFMPRHSTGIPSVRTPLGPRTTSRPVGSPTAIPHPSRFVGRPPQKTVQSLSGTRTVATGYPPLPSGYDPMASSMAPLPRSVWIPPQETVQRTAPSCPRTPIFVYDGMGREVCHGESCGSSANQKAKKIYSTIVQVREFFYQNFELCGIDGRGAIAPVSIGWSQRNAQWTCQTGECSWKFSDEFVSQPAVVAHEYTHAIISSKARLNAPNESGALGEHLADVFGLLFQSWAANKPITWTIAGRDFSQLPFRYQNEKTPSMLNDMGHVHENSKVPSHVFYIAATREQIPIPMLATIWFETMLMLAPDENFSSFAAKTVLTARRHCPDCAVALERSWNTRFPTG